MSDSQNPYANIVMHQYDTWSNKIPEDVVIFDKTFFDLENARAALLALECGDVPLSSVINSVKSVSTEFGFTSHTHILWLVYQMNTYSDGLPYALPYDIKEYL